MNILEMSSPEAIEAANNFVRKIKDGTIKKRTLPNTGKQFNEEKALESLKSSCRKNVIKEVAKRVYGQDTKG